MKKVFVSVLVLFGVLSSSIVVNAGEAPYTDMPYANFEAVLQMYNDGIFTGYSDGTFGAYNYINRAELAKVLVLSTGVTDDEIKDAVDMYVDTYGVDEAEFTDVDPTMSADELWYVDYVIYAKSRGWVSGYPDGSYQPGNNVNLVEALKMIVESQYGSPGEEYYDGTQWYDKYLNFLGTFDVLNDYASGYDTVYYGYNDFMPVGDLADDIYRTDVAELLYRMRECVGENGDMSMYDPYLTAEEYEDVYGAVFVVNDGYLSVYDSYFNFELENVHIGDYELSELEFNIQDPSGFTNGFTTFWEIKYPYEQWGETEYWDPMWINIVDSDYAVDWYPVSVVNDHGQGYAIYCFTSGVTDDLQDIADGVCDGNVLSEDINLASSDVTKSIADEFFLLVDGGDYEDAYDSTSDLFGQYTSYEDFVSEIESGFLYGYVDLVVNDIEYSGLDGVVRQTLYADWYDVYEYYPVKIYFTKNNGVWELDGFYFY